jgi:hypothetical protein
MFPSLSKARRKSQQVICLNNEKQQYLNYTYYSDDNNGYVPLHYVTSDRRNSNEVRKNNSGVRLNNWAITIRDGYLNNAKILVDPTYEGTNDEMIKKGDIAADVGSTDSTDNSKIKTHYSARPVIKRVLNIAKNELLSQQERDQLSLLQNYTKKAIFSCGLYGMHPSIAGGPYHNMEGVNTVYGDGSGFFNKGSFVGEMANVRENVHYYQTDNDGDIDLNGGFWFFLDQGRD